MADAPQLTILGKLAVLIFIGACFAGAYYMYSQSQVATSNNQRVTSDPNTTASPIAPQAVPHPAVPPGMEVQLGIAYGTEKKKWLEWAVQQFEATPDGQKIKIDLIPLGSLEGAHAILSGDKRIDVWSPASSLYKDVFVSEWQIKFSSDPIFKEEPLALTPMVFVFWDARYQAFVQKYQAATFKTIGEALKEKGGWDGIAQKPDWGFFKFGHTNPNESNSGLMALVLMAYDYHNKTGGLAMKDIVDASFQTWMQDFEHGVSGLSSNSTGNMMREMILKGPSAYDSVLVYENLAIDYLKNAEGRWGDLRVVYPKKNIWNDHPYYILNASWVSAAQRKASETFLAFLLSETIQAEALKHGFRPANTNVGVRGADSPFTLYSKNGLQLDLPTVCDSPKAEIVNNLLTSWQRSQGGR